MVNKINKILIIIALPILLSGCWDYEDINKRTITLSIGVDLLDDKTVFNGEIARLVSEAGRITASVTEVYQFTSKGKDFEEARSDFDSIIPFTDFSGAMTSVTFCKEYAEEKGIEPYINRLSFTPGFRYSLPVAISKEHTEELFKNKVVNDISVGHGIADTLRQLEKDGAAVYTTAQDIRHNLSFKEIGFVVPYITKEENIIKYLGLAVIKNSKCIGIIEAKESSGFLYITGKKAISVKAIPNPQNETNQLSIKTKFEKRKISTDYHEGKIYINIKLELISQLQYEYLKEPISLETLKQLEDIIANTVKGEVISSIKRSQEEFECDIFGFGRYFKADNPNIFKTINWVEKYPDAVFRVEVKSKIVNYNLMNIKFKDNYKGRAQ